MELAAGDRPRCNSKILLDCTAKSGERVVAVGYDEVHILMNDIRYQRSPAVGGLRELPSIILVNLIHRSIKRIIRAEPHIIAPLRPGV